MSFYRNVSKQPAPRIDVVITSPFHRCVQTAAAIIEVLPERYGKKVAGTTLIGKKPLITDTPWSHMS